MTIELWSRRVGALGQFHVEDPSSPVLASADDHHLNKVLRARVDEEVVVTDGHGTWSICTVQDHGLLRVTDVHTDPAMPETVLYLSPLKGDRSEWAVAKATELGVSRIVPLQSRHLAVKFNGPVRDKVIARWRRIAFESAAQSRRTYDMLIDETVQCGEVDPTVAVADFSGGGDWNGVRAVAIGPEGGWSVDEWEAGRTRLSLGPTVLRAETAAVVAASLLAFGAGGWGFTLSGVSNR